MGSRHSAFLLARLLGQPHEHAKRTSDPDGGITRRGNKAGGPVVASPNELRLDHRSPTQRSRQAASAGGDHHGARGVLPGVPTVASFVPGFEASIWFGVGAAANTPADIVGRLNAEINAGLADPRLKARVMDLGATVLAGSPAEFARFITDETEKWGKVIRAANIKPE
jgi:hypothetical protein